MVIKVAVIVVFCLLFWAGCYVGTGTDQKNMKGFRSYPIKVQELVRRNEELSKLAPKKVSIPFTILLNIVMFVVIFGIIGVILKFTVGFSSFAEILIYFLIFGEVLNLFDLVVIDLLWWRNTKRIRFSFIPEKQFYQNPKQHVDSFLRGILVFAIVAAVVSTLMFII